ncbi:hypothetical protein NKJ06_32250 [Mesorhizobium sp. M0293]
MQCLEAIGASSLRLSE